MKKFKTISGEEVQIGDIVDTTIIKDDVEVTIIGELKEEYLTFLLEQQILEPIENPVPHSIEFFIERLAKRRHWNIDNMHNYLKNILSISKTAFMSIILKEIAIFLDEDYPDHISKSEEIWIISMLNGKVGKITDKSKIVTYKSFAAFRSKRAACIALSIISPVIEELFGSGK